jgi:hypothetical protein
MKKNYFVLSLVFVFLLSNPLSQLGKQQHKENQFRQLYEELPTPNSYRTAAGAPGPDYWQQQADYDMTITLDEDKKRLYGMATITYYNHSPEQFSFLWLQLDQNNFNKGGLINQSRTGRISKEMTFSRLKRLHNDFDGGFKIEFVQDEEGNNLHYQIVDTMMRVDLPSILKSKSQFTLKIKWWYNINDKSKIGGRCGFRYFEKDKNSVFTIAQFFPRLAVYNEAEGWQHKQYFGSGEFALPFGNYSVQLTVPADHIIGATGVLQNPHEVLSEKQTQLLEKAKKETKKTVVIVSEKEVIDKEKFRSDKTKTWIFKAKNVRDFAFASSRKFIWDAMAVKFKTHTSLAMSLYDKSGNPLWGKYSTKAVAHAMKVYSKFTFDYPYPKSISVLSGRGGGMEYPMMAFNGGLSEADRTYSKDRKYSLIGVVIHEFGHNFFPMIVNSDERQWAWMDEGLNTFLTYLSEEEWERSFEDGSGPAYSIINYMKRDKSQIYPIMTAPDIDLNVGANAYSKTAAGLNILRDTIMGRELFDFAFKEYARRWKFKHPTPADFFRTMEDASGMDLDWFWRGWFYGTNHVDLALENVKWYKVNSGDPRESNRIKLEEDKEKREKYISHIRNRQQIKATAVEKDKALIDFYDTHDPLKVTSEEKEKYDKYLKSLDTEEKKLLNSKDNYYEFTITNRGGMVMPVILRLEYADGSEEIVRIPAEIWRRDNDQVTKVITTKKAIKHILMDPYLETADVDTNNNHWTIRGKPGYFKVKKFKRTTKKNLMQKFKK